MQRSIIVDAVCLLSVFTTCSFATVVIESGSVDCFTNGTVGRAGSSSGSNSDDPAQLDGTSGVLLLEAVSWGGPVPPAEPQSSFPGTTAEHLESAAARQEMLVGSAGAMVMQDALAENSLDHMDGAGLVAASNAGVVARCTFTLSVETPFSLTGELFLDDEDTVGGISFPGIYIFQNGPFSRTGVLAPGTYTLHSTCGVAATAGSSGVPLVGAVSEAASFSVVLTLGTPPCDSIDFNNDGLYPDNFDLVDFLAVFGGGECPTGVCNDIDFNNDGLYPDNTDIISLFSVFGGGGC